MSVAGIKKTQKPKYQLYFEEHPKLCGTPVKFAPSIHPPAYKKQLENRWIDFHEI
jgi:hypothetical protein